MAGEQALRRRKQIECQQPQPTGRHERGKAVGEQAHQRIGGPGDSPLVRTPPCGIAPEQRALAGITAVAAQGDTIAVATRDGRKVSGTFVQVSPSAVTIHVRM